MNGIRFSVAGGFLYAVLRLRGVPAPTRVQWWNALRTGLLLLGGGVGLVTIAEDLGVGSGIAATAVAIIPWWAALFAGAFGEWPARREWTGLLIGFVGVAVLAQEGDLQASPLGLGLLVLSPMAWAFGSVWGKRLDLPPPLMTAAAQLLAGGGALLLLGPLRGERLESAPGLSAWLALAYLIVLGSIVAFAAYIYLLNTVSPVLATSYAYANPVVAVLLGVTIGGETITGAAWVALPLILAGVCLVLTARQRPRASVRYEEVVVEEAAA